METKKIVVSESVKRIGVNQLGRRCRTRQVIYHYKAGKKKNGKPAVYSITQHEPINE